MNCRSEHRVNGYLERGVIIWKETSSPVVLTHLNSSLTSSPVVLTNLNSSLTIGWML